MMLVSVLSVCAEDNPTPKPLKALLIAGGCCHDYAGQHKVLSEGIQARANVQVDVYWTDDRSTTPSFPLYEKDDWAEGYDVIIHDECAAGIKDVKVVERIINEHRSVPAVHLHCAMHSWRTGTDMWFKFLGLQSSGHGPKEPLTINFVDGEHPATKGLKGWTTGKEELYNNVNIFDARPLAKGKQIVKRKGVEKEVEAVVVWTNEQEGVRSFSTSLGHNTETVADSRYLELVTRGLLWSCEKLSPEYQTPFKGKNKVTFIKGVPNKTKKKKGKGKKGQTPQATIEMVKPKDATEIKMTASSVQMAPGHFPWKAVDGNDGTRWCASNDSYPQWLQIELNKPHKIDTIRITWEFDVSYKYIIEGSGDGKKWTPLLDVTQKGENSGVETPLKSDPVKFVRITGKSAAKGWCSIREVKLKSPTIKSLWPAGAKSLPSAKGKPAARSPDPYAKAGNLPPKMVKLTSEKEQAILKEVKVPPEFDVTVFAAPPTVNYPVYCAASPSGDLYVSSDGNGSLGRDPDRGRVLRLRDKDGDGRADEVTEFIKNIDAPRGLIWDHDRLYLLHPPDISVHFDRDGDGVSEESKMLIKGIAFDYKGRPADHTTNGLQMGIDGWIYIAGGDFGFVDAVGTDGQHLQHRGGGVIRFRPDGSGLEIFSTGTRNILEVPISPLLDLFARDNTNDGGGWDVRFHHFTGLEDHGYPRMYKNFGSEHIAPLADYGGGSGCGGVYISEPGFPAQWNNAPFTCDWGKSALFKHTVKPKGATFEETETPQAFIKLPRATDADVDGMSRVYQLSWKGAKFRWEGWDVGYVVQVKPKGYQPSPLPEFEDLSSAELVKLLESPGSVRRLTAQRALLRRPEDAETTNALVALADDAGKPLPARVAALFAITQRGFKSENAAAVIKTVTPLARDSSLRRFVIRALGDMGLDRRSGADTPRPLGPIFIEALKNADPAESVASRTKVEAIIAATRQNLKETGPAIAALLGNEDPVVVHTAFRGLAMLGASEACFAIVDNPQSPGAQREGALLALMRMHKPEVVDGIIARIGKEDRPEVRKGFLSALCRLHNIEGEWKGQSWGTRPDTRGPYYQPEPWSETSKIAAVLKAALENASPDEAPVLLHEMTRNRIQSDDALGRIIELAGQNSKLIAIALKQMATAKTIPAKGIPLLLHAARDKEAETETLTQAITALSKVDHADAFPSMLEALVSLDAAKGNFRSKQSAWNAFLKAPRLENHHLALESEANKKGSAAGLWADAGLIALASRRKGSPESRELSQRAIDDAWKIPQRRIRLMRAAAKVKNRYLDHRILASLDDPNQKVSKAAQHAAKGLRLRKQPPDTTPKIATLKPADAIKRAVKMKGNAAIGELVFTRAGCITCHTTSQGETPRGPYLGNIAQTYKRPELAEAILVPSKSIAQGFTTNLFLTEDDEVLQGFITFESADEVKLRDINGKEFTLKKSDIAERKTVPASAMPEGLMKPFSLREFASLVDYLQGLSKKQ